MVNRVLALTSGSTEDDAPNEREIVLNPAFDLGLVFPNLSIDLDGRYGLRYIWNAPSLTNHIAEANIYFNSLLPKGLGLDGSIGLLWYFDKRIYYPFQLNFTGVIKDQLDFKLNGGYSFTQTTLYSQWQ